MQDDHVLKKLKFDLLNPKVEGVSGGTIFNTIVLHSQLYLICMQHNHVLKKLNFVLTPSVGSGK